MDDQGPEATITRLGLAMMAGATVLGLSLELSTRQQSKYPPVGSTTP